MAPSRKLSRGQNEVINQAIPVRPCGRSEAIRPAASCHDDPVKRTRGQSVWTPERRAAAAERARKHKPFRHSTGPRTASGKARSRLNAWKHGSYCQSAKNLRMALRRYSLFLKDINKMVTQEQRRRRTLESSFPIGANPAIKASCFPEQDKIRSQK